MQLLFRALPLSDVDHRGQHEESLVGFKGVEAYLPGDLSTVFAQAEQFPARAHLSDLWIGKKAAPERFVTVTLLSRQEHVHRLSQQIIGGVAECLFDLTIDQHDS